MGLGGVDRGDQDRRRIGGGLHPAGLLHFAHDVGVVVRVGTVGVGNHRQRIQAVGIRQGECLAFIPGTIVVTVQEDFPVGQADLVIGRACHIVDPIGIAQAVAVHVAELHATDLAHDDGRRGQLDRGGATAIDVHRGLQRAPRPGVGASRHAFALVGHIARGRDHEAVLDFGAAGRGGGTGVDEGDGDLGVDRAAGVSVKGDLADFRDVGIDGAELAVHAAQIDKAAIGLCGIAGEAARAAVGVGRGHVDKAARVGVALVVVVGHIERIGLSVDQGGVVAGLVVVDMRDHFTFEIVGFAVGEDVVVPLGAGASGGVAIGPVLVDLAHAGAGGGSGHRARRADLRLALGRSVGV